MQHFVQMEGFYFDYGGAIPEFPDELMDCAETDDNGDGDESSSVSRALTVNVEQPELADWHGDLLKEIQKLRDMYLPEIKDAYRRVYEFWSQSPEAANKADGDKRFLESALKILALARDDEIERPKTECFHVLTVIESYVLRSRNENLTKPYEEQQETPVLQYRVGAAVSGDPFVQIGMVELAEWKEDLREEIEWMKLRLLPEINQAYIGVCRLLSQCPDSAKRKEEKIFIEFALNFLDLTDDKIKWPKNECFDIVRRIKSYVLHLRDTKYVEQRGEHLWKPQCQFQIHGLQQQLNEKIGANLSLTSAAWCDPCPLNAVPCEPLSPSKWPRLANRHNQMYEEFVSLRNEFLAIVTVAFKMYSKLSLKNRKKYLALAFNFEFCMKFLSFSTSDMLLISKDQFDYYARKIKMLVTGVDSMVSLYMNNDSAAASSPICPKKCLYDSDSGAESADTSFSRIKRPASSNSGLRFRLPGTVDWHEDLQKQYSTMKEIEASETWRKVCDGDYLDIGGTTSPQINTITSLAFHINEEENTVGFGLVHSNMEGQWITGYFGSLYYHESCILETQMTGFLEASEVLKSLNVHGGVIHSSSKIPIHTIYSEKIPKDKIVYLAGNIYEKMQRIREILSLYSIKLRFVTQDRNEPAQWLAMMASRRENPMSKVPDDLASNKILRCYLDEEARCLQIEAAHRLEATSYSTHERPVKRRKQEKAHVGKVIQIEDTKSLSRHLESALKEGVMMGNEGAEMKGNWTKAMEDLLLKKANEYADSENIWRAIQPFFPGFTNIQLRNKYYSISRRTSKDPKWEETKRKRVEEKSKKRQEKWKKGNRKLMYPDQSLWWNGGEAPEGGHAEDV